FRHFDQILLVVQRVFRQKAVSLFDSALREVPGDAKVRTAGTARAALRVSTGSADHRDDQIARADALDLASDLDDFCERLVAENQVIRSRRRAAELKRADFPVSATEADLAHSEEHAGRVLQPWLRYFDELKSLVRRKYGQGLHGVTPQSARRG